MADLDTAEACTNAYSDIEEDFFRAGDEISAGSAAEPIADDPTPIGRKSLWSRVSRLFHRDVRLPTDDLMPVPQAPVAARTRPPTERPAADDSGEEEWDWMLAVARARARHATQPGM